LETKLKGRHFDTTEVTEGESQAVVFNTFTEHDFQDEFKNMTEALGMVHMRRMGLLQG
jgi:hypothetical protein